jgi:hypothetical protein
MINNPNYKGKWKPAKIPNPDYFRDDEPFKMAAIGKRRCFPDPELDTLKVPSGQIGSAREWYHWTGLERDINAIGFRF